MHVPYWRVDPSNEKLKSPKITYRELLTVVILVDLKPISKVLSLFQGVTMQCSPSVGETFPVRQVPLPAQTAVNDDDVIGRLHCDCAVTGNTLPAALHPGVDLGPEGIGIAVIIVYFCKIASSRLDLCR